MRSISSPAATTPTLPPAVLLGRRRARRSTSRPARPAPCARRTCFPTWAKFTDFALRYVRRSKRRYDLVHANFFMSALVAAEIKRATGIPFVVTFHALGRVRRLHQAGADAFPEERLAIEERVVAEADRIIAECPQDEQDLIEHYHADPRKIATIPCGFDPSEFWPHRSGRGAGQAGPCRRTSRSSSNSAGWCRGRAWTTSSAAWPALRDRGHRRPAARRRRRVARSRPGDHPGDRPPPGDRPRGGGGRRRDLRRQPGPAGASRLLQRGRCLRLDPLVRAVRDHAAGGDGLRHAGHRLGGGRHQGDGPRRRDGLPRPAERSGRARRQARRLARRSGTPAGPSVAGPFATSTPCTPGGAVTQSLSDLYEDVLGTRRTGRAGSPIVRGPSHHTWVTQLGDRWTDGGVGGLSGCPGYHLSYLLVHQVDKSHQLRNS